MDLHGLLLGWLYFLNADDVRTSLEKHVRASTVC
jgi:hypothetical protein